jgi:hypothetical protein
MTKKKNNEDLSGFQDFIDAANDGPSKIPRKNRVDGFELLTFLEQDSQRLENMIRLYEEKAFLLKNYPQDTDLIIKLDGHNSFLRQQLIEKLGKKNSPLMKSLAEMFNPHFNS